MKLDNLCKPPRYIETIFQLRTHDGYTQPLGFLCKPGSFQENYPFPILLGRVFPRTKLYQLLSSINKGKARIYLTNSGFDFYKAVFEHSPPVFWYAYMDGLFKTLPGREAIFIRFIPDTFVATDNIQAPSRADFCLIEILVWYTKYRSGIIEKAEYLEWYERCSHSIKRSSRDETYTRILDRLAP